MAPSSSIILIRNALSLTFCLSVVLASGCGGPQVKLEEGEYLKRLPKTTETVEEHSQYFDQQSEMDQMAESVVLETSVPRPVLAAYFDSAKNYLDRSSSSPDAFIFWSPQLDVPVIADAIHQWNRRSTFLEAQSLTGGEQGGFQIDIYRPAYIYSQIFVLKEGDEIKTHGFPFTLITEEFFCGGSLSTSPASSEEGMTQGNFSGGDLKIIAKVIHVEKGCQIDVSGVDAPALAETITWDELNSDEREQILETYLRPLLQQEDLSYDPLLRIPGVPSSAAPIVPDETTTLESPAGSPHENSLAFSISIDRALNRLIDRNQDIVTSLQDVWRPDRFLWRLGLVGQKSGRLNRSQLQALYAWGRAEGSDRILLAQKDYQETRLELRSFNRVWRRGLFPSIDLLSAQKSSGEIPVVLSAPRITRNSERTKGGWPGSVSILLGRPLLGSLTYKAERGLSQADATSPQVVMNEVKVQPSFASSTLTYEATVQMKATDSGPGEQSETSSHSVTENWTFSLQSLLSLPPSPILTMSQPQIVWSAGTEDDWATLWTSIQEMQLPEMGEEIVPFSTFKRLSDLQIQQPSR